MQHWKWVVRCTYNDTVKPPKNPGELAIETVHMDDASKDIEVQAAKARGDVNIEVFPYSWTNRVMDDQSKKLRDLMRFCPVCAAELVVTKAEAITTNPYSVRIWTDKHCPKAHVTLDIAPNPVYSHEEAAAVFTPEDFIFQEN